MFPLNLSMIHDSGEHSLSQLPKHGFCFPFWNFFGIKEGLTNLRRHFNSSQSLCPIRNYEKLEVEVEYKNQGGESQDGQERKVLRPQDCEESLFSQNRQWSW